MTDYISRQAAFEALEKRGVSTTNISRVPVADVRENVRGEWIDKGKNWTVTNGVISMEIPVKECSVCGRPYLYIITDRFCPNCGAEMRGDNNGKRNDS